MVLVVFLADNTVTQIPFEFHMQIPMTVLLVSGVVMSPLSQIQTPTGNILKQEMVARLWLES